MKILIIGNGPSALAKKMGKEIDSFDGLVARFNNYRTDGFEEFIGSRTDVWITCDAFPRNYAKTFKETLFVTFLLDSQECKSFEHLKTIKPDAKRIPYSAMLETKQKIGYNAPSSGAVATTYFLSIGYEVILYGFNYMQSDVHHFIDKVGMGENHIPDKEWVYFNQLISDGKIDILGWDKKNEGIPIIRQPEVCGQQGIGQYRESTQMGWYNWIARSCLNSTVLDVGCGLGNGMKEMALAPGSTVHGIDTDPALSEVVKNYSCESIYNVEKQYDIVTCIDAIEHVVEDLRFFRKLLSIARKKLYITTPNFSRSKALNHAHCREYSISQFLNIFKPDQLWVASPDGWFNLRCLVVGNETTYPMNRIWNDSSVDGLEWGHYCGIWNK